MGIISERKKECFILVHCHLAIHIRITLFLSIPYSHRKAHRDQIYCIINEEEVSEVSCDIFSDYPIL